MDLLKTPKENIAESEVISVTEAQVKIKGIIWEDLQNNVEKKVTEQKLIDYIESVSIKGLDKKVVGDSLRALARNTYWITSRNLRTLQENYKSAMKNEAPSYTTDSTYFNLKQEQERFRPFIDTNPKGLAVIEDYRKKVQGEIRALASDPAMAKFIGKDGLSNYSLRNYAEMTVRYNANVNDVNKLVEDGKDLVWTSSHADASIRCEPWQGRLYSLQGRSGTIDGIPYTPFSEAIAGENGDGNGIIDGYNCRHRVIEYQRGSKPPVEYSKEEIRKERAIDQNQRRYENEIRRMKAEEKLNRANGDTKRASELRERWQQTNRRYEAYSIRNGRAFYRWRTEIE